MIIKKNLDEVTRALGIETLPERWRGLYARAIKGECPMADIDYYIDLNRRYGVLEGYLDLYREALADILSDETKYAFFRLLLLALEDRERIDEELGALGGVFATGTLGWRMMPALAMSKSTPAVYDSLKRRGLDEDIIRGSLKVHEAGIEVYRSRHGGENGYANFDWFMLAYDAKLISIEGLTYELPCEFPSIARVYKNERGEIISLADSVAVHRSGYPLGTRLFEDGEGSFFAEIVEEDGTITAHPYNEDGLIGRETLTLNAHEWSLVLSGGAPVVSIHIPRGADIRAEAIDTSLLRAREIFKKCYPEYKYSAFIFESWMMDRRLPNLIGKEKNITKLASRFIPLIMKSRGVGVFGFVFNRPSGDVDIDSLEETTSLMRALKQFYKDGNAIYEMCGFSLT